MSELLDYLVQNEKDFRKFVPSFPVTMVLLLLLT